MCSFNNHKIPCKTDESSTTTDRLAVVKKNVEYYPHPREQPLCPVTSALRPSTTPRRRSSSGFTIRPFSIMSSSSCVNGGAGSRGVAEQTVTMRAVVHQRTVANLCRVCTYSLAWCLGLAQSPRYVVPINASALQQLWSAMLR